MYALIKTVLIFVITTIPVAALAHVGGLAGNLYGHVVAHIAELAAFLFVAFTGARAWRKARSIRQSHFGGR